jgi:dihydroneopterin triphosphate diphosphatase
MRKPVQIAIYIYRIRRGNREYLLFKRTAESGGFWQGVTGGVEDDETVFETAVRELEEETGFAGTEILQIDYRRTFPVPESMKHHFSPEVTTLTEYAFYTEVACGLTPALDSREHSEYKWVSYDMALTMLKYPGNKEALMSCEGKLNSQASGHTC